MLYSTLLVSLKLTTIPIAEFNSSRKIKCTRRTAEKVGEYRTSLPALNKAGLQFHPFWMLERTLGEGKWLSGRKREWNSKGIGEGGNITLMRLLEKLGGTR